MTKRRRERDRPKASQDAPYNPNKRVLLSYASDEEQEVVVEQSAGTGHPTAVDVASANYEIAEYLDDDAVTAAEDIEVPSSAVASRATSEAAGDGKHKHRGDGRAKSSRGVPRNATTGQAPAIGTLAYQWDEDDEEGEYESAEEEAMAYLRAVR